LATVIDISTLITNNPGIHRGSPIIAGTRVTVRRIAIWYQQGYRAEEIYREIETITLGPVYAALAYYYVNREDIDAEIVAQKAESAEIEALQRSHANG
jgi:uncharacterized protein (DUF433 family)